MEAILRGRIQVQIEIYRVRVYAETTFNVQKYGKTQQTWDKSHNQKGLAPQVVELGLISLGILQRHIA